jgi:hypothetical protein
MKYIHNEKGMALITALMFTLICLAIIMTLMYYVLTGTKMSAAQKRYRNSLEASYGGTELVTKTIIPRLFNNYTTGKPSLLADFGDPSQIALLLGPDLKTKLINPTSGWGAASKTVNPKESPDITFTLRGQNANNHFKVYSKIVDTVAGVGLIDESGIDYLDPGIGTAGTSNSTQTPRTPNIYSIEVQGEAEVNPKEKAALSVLYAY